VWDIHVWHDLDGLSPHEIVSEYPQLSVADVHAALTYFWDNEEVIRMQMNEPSDLPQQLPDHGTVDWDARIETLPARDSEEIVLRFQEGAARLPRIIADPED
jgi:hypothetical protein